MAALTWQAPFQDPATAEKTTGTCAVGLAVLSSICRVPQIAQSADMIEKVPLFVKVSNGRALCSAAPGAQPVGSLGSQTQDCRW